MRLPGSPRRAQGLLCIALFAVAHLLQLAQAVDVDVAADRRHHGSAAHLSARKAMQQASSARTVVRKMQTRTIDGPCHGAVHVDRSTNGQNSFSYHKCGERSGHGVVAWGTFDDNIVKTGWSELNVNTSPLHTDLEQAYAAGYFEGYITRERIAQFMKVVKSNHAHDDIYKFLQTQDDFLRSKVRSVDTTSMEKEDVYWYNIALVLAQMDGVLDGYNTATVADEEKINILDLWLLNSDGDMVDIERAATPGRKYKKVQDMTEAELIEMVSIHNRCSAFIKWTGADLLASHATWDDYSEMIRMYKHYNFHFKHASIKSQQSSHSSYPGFVSSSDDFYILDTGLVVIETTLNILDEQLFDQVDPAAQVLAWVRNLVANRLATTGKEWCEVFARHNSGTYNDQWMILDYNLFEPNMKALKPHTVWVLEQIPGFIHTEDVSHIVSRDTYWASYNRPFFTSINERSMYMHYTKKHGEMFSYRDCPRAKIFFRDHKTVTDVESMKRLMTQNNWQTDPFAKGCPGNAIAARFDIEAPDCKMSRVANGATDAKIVASAWVGGRRSAAISGPTHNGQEPFTWRNPMFVSEMHDGQPTLWDFDWIEMSPASLPASL